MKNYKEFLNDKNPVCRIDMGDLGSMEVELFPEVAPITVKNFLDLVSNNFYNGIIFKIWRTRGASLPFARLSASYALSSALLHGRHPAAHRRKSQFTRVLHPFRPAIHKIAPNGKRSLVIVRNVVYNRNRIPW